MISFHKAEAADRVWAHEILKNCEYPGAEYAFSCMYLWSDYFGELGRVGDHLTQHASWRGREVYLYPAGAGDIKGAIEAIRREGEAMPGMFRVLVEARAGTFVPGDDLLFIIAAGDIRENVLNALTHTLTRIKAEAITKREVAP